MDYWLFIALLERLLVVYSIIRWREENEQLMNQQLSKVKQMDEEKSDIISNMYKKLEEGEKEKSMEIERLKDIQR